MEEKNIKSALVLGGTGMVGSELVKYLIEDEKYNKVVLIGRRPSGIHHSKVKDLLVDFDKPDEWRQLIKGSVLFSAFGTTIKKAGSQENQYRIDYNYQYRVAEAAAHNKVDSYVIISSLGADFNSKVFYSKMKGELDRDVKALDFENVLNLKPSLLLGNRKEVRTGESLGAIIGTLIKYVPYLSKFRPIQAKVVAKAMLVASANYKGSREFVADELFKLAEKWPLQ
jgi:uncharacterized protein YbjT (DUF2867 family)